MKRTALTVTALAVAAAGMILVNACSSGSTEGGGGQGGDQAATPETTAPAAGTAEKTAPPPAPAGKGTIKGKVAFTGKAPEATPINRDSDPVCKAIPMNTEDVIVKNGSLVNTLVRVTKGIRTPTPGTGSVEIDQKACMYRPRVMGMVAGQKLAIKNADQTMHNVHTYAGTETVFNRAQVPGSPAIEREFTDAGAMLTFKCDVHPWMAGFVAVMNHPHFAVTGDDGSFELKDVPAGTYTIETWHERYGTKTQEVTVAPDGTAEISFSYDGTESAG